MVKKASLLIIVILAGFLLANPVKRAPSYIETPSERSIVLHDSTKKLSQGTIDAVVEKNLAAGRKPNRLVKEKSPYLLQHAFNPVDWYPWGEEAFEKAHKEGKPIFLSIGYSTCYWCHVMEREVFENDSIAALMNKFVVSIKVDREERPDIDRVYMTALQAMTGSGGWPMSIFMTPDLKPFFAATYIPPTPKSGRAGFSDLLQHIHEIWTHDRQKIYESSEKVGEYLRQVSAPAVKATEAGQEELEKGFASFSRMYDSRNAGFGSAPKFPRPVSLYFLLRYYKRTGEQHALEMSLETLRKMARGGIYDHVGGGFHRYATDERWHVPHFEKMIYDQAQLVISYLEAYQITHDVFFAEVARDILAYVQRNMTDSNGGFYSAEDAESVIDRSNPEKKEEGAFYTWTKKEIDANLSAQESRVLDYYYGVQDKGNVVAGPQRSLGAKNILYIAHSMEETAKYFNLKPESVRKTLSLAKEKLSQQREKRPKPHLDDKILVSWNGLMISAFARAYQVLGSEEYLRAAEHASSFVLKTMYDPKTRILLRRYRDGEARFEATLEDYAFLTQGLIDLYEASLDIRWIKNAIELTERQNALFYDSKDGGFYDITGSDKTILIRTKESYCGAEPAGNSIAIFNLLRLSQMTDNRNYRQMAERSLAYFGQQMTTSPQDVPQFLAALDFSLSKPMQVIIAGKPRNQDTQAILKELHSRFIPNKIVLLADATEGQEVLSSYIPFVEGIRMVNGKATAYICENYACQLPTSDLRVLAQQLDRKQGTK
jgi:uncharacterized protein YyaL (SSP411 family)